MFSGRSYYCWSSITLTITSCASCLWILPFFFHLLFPIRRQTLTLFLIQYFVHLILCVSTEECCRSGKLRFTWFKAISFWISHPANYLNNRCSQCECLLDWRARLFIWLMLDDVRWNDSFLLARNIKPISFESDICGSVSLSKMLLLREQRVIQGLYFDIYRKHH